MSDLVDQITEVIDKHTPTGSDGPTGSGLVNCWCDERFDTFADHAAHVAAAVAAQLQLTLEATPGRHPDCYRWVSPHFAWSEVQP